MTARTYSRETLRSGDNVIRSFRNAPKAHRLIRAIDWTRLHWDSVSDGVYAVLIIVGIAITWKAPAIRVWLWAHGVTW